VPEVTSVSPTFVANPGSDGVTINGSGFTGATKVMIGDHTELSFSVQSDTEVWAVTHNEYSKGSRVSVYVEGPGGKSGEPGEPGWLTLGEGDYG